MPGRLRAHLRRWFPIALLAGIVGFPIGWVVSDRIEQDNDFCTSCHLRPDVPLHGELRRAFDTAPAPNLAAAHGDERVDGREDGFRCIDCHGGASWKGRARVKALAVKDAFWYLTGQFDEPTEMAWPLWDEDCRKCHTEFRQATSNDWETPNFHELSVHNVDLGIDCVKCHRAHASGGNPDNFFIGPDWVRPQCAQCHESYLY